MLFSAHATSGIALFKRPGVAVLVALTACISALLAHIAIDIAGDYLLPHDAYDDISHGSRILVACSTLAVLIGVALRLLVAALEHARATRPAVRAVSAGVARGRVCAYVAGVLVATFALLGGMERLDLFLVGQSIDDLADLLGGSFVLGTAITLPIALAAGCISWRIARWAGCAHIIVVEIVAAWFVTRNRRVDAVAARPRRPRRRFALAPALARSSSKRGPPLTLR